MIRSPVISVCIPAYRAERYLAETLASVRAQTFAAWELIVVEDGSRDTTESLVSTFAATVSQSVRYLRHEKNRGLSTTRNTAIAAAAAPWIALLDADDLWTPEHLAELLAATETHAADLVHSGCVLFDDVSGKELGIRAPSAEVIKDLPLSLFDGRYIIQPSSVLMRTELLTRLGGFSPAFFYVEDRDMWIRCLRAGAKLACTGNTTCRYRKHPGAMSNNSARMAESCAAVFDQHRDWKEIPPLIRRRLAAEAWTSAARLRQRSDPAMAVAHFARALAIEWTPGRLTRLLACRLLALLPSRPQRP